MQASNTAVWAIAIAGSAIGIFGGLIGTWATIHNAKGSNERRLAYRLAVIGCVYMSLLMVGFFLVPQPYGMILHAINLCVLLQIPRINRWFQQARDEDLATTAKPKDAWPLDELA